MSYSNFPSGITSFGIPTFGAGGLLPFTGAYFWVNAAIGSDGNTGAANQPFATLGQALLAVSNYPMSSSQTNVIFLTGNINLTATLAWNVNNTWLVGLGAPGGAGPASITATGTVFTPLVNVTATNCGFVNFQAIHGFNNASTQICWAEAAGGNYYNGVSFNGMNHATAGAQAGSRNLTVAGAGNNEFVNCIIGGTAIVRATGTNAGLEFLSGTANNVFTDCISQANCTNTADLHFLAAASSITGTVLFRDCTFINVGAGTLAVAATVNSGAGGVVLLQGTLSYGATVYATTGPIAIVAAVPVATTSGLAVLAT